jgi:hypothetical protein
VNTLPPFREQTKPISSIRNEAKCVFMRLLG